MENVYQPFIYSRAGITMAALCFQNERFQHLQICAEVIQHEKFGAQPFIFRQFFQTKGDDRIIYFFTKFAFRTIPEGKGWRYFSLFSASSWASMPLRYSSLYSFRSALSVTKLKCQS